VQTTAKTRQEELKKMGNHSVPSKQTLKRTVAAGTIAGCSAVGLGALSTLAAPTANACWFGCHSTHTTTTNTSTNTGVSVTASQNNGNTTQSTGALSGNQFSVPIGLGLTPATTSANTSINNVSAANGAANTIVITAFQLPVTTNTNICTGATTPLGAGSGTHCTAG